MSERSERTISTGGRDSAAPERIGSGPASERRERRLRSERRRATAVVAVAVLVLSLVLGACGVGSVSISSSESTGTDPTGSSSGQTDPSGSDTTIANEPGSSTSSDLDDLLPLVAEDIDTYWSQEFAAVYGADYRTLQGGIFAVTPDSVDVPGCQSPRTSYTDIEGNAFYCSEGDFIAYDAFHLMPELNDAYNGFVPAMVLAHEWGHAIQDRAGVFTQPLPTIVLEQQADCFAGSWARWVADGMSPNFKSLNEDDLTFAVAGLLEFRDQPGTLAEDPAAHGNAFDRVSAFQEGFEQTAARCAEYPTNPPPITQTGFTTQQEAESGGNLPYDENLAFITNDLQRFWQATVQAAGKAFAPVEFVPLADLDDAPQGCQLSDAELDTGAAWCAADAPGSVVYDDDELEQLNFDTGDFAVAALLAHAYADAMQEELGTGLVGAPRSLFADCATGAWAGDVAQGNGRSGGQPISLSSGDLDEALSAFLAFRSDSPDEGSVFERVGGFRDGYLQGIAACNS